MVDKGRKVLQNERSMQKVAEPNNENISISGSGGSKKSIYGIVIVVLVAILVLGYFLYVVSQGGVKKEPLAPAQVVQEDTSKKGEIGYQEPTTTVQIGSEKVSGGSFVKVEDGKIFFNSSGTETVLPLTSDEVVLACTNQTLAGASELDYDQITSIHPEKPTEIGGKIPASEYVVVFAEYVEGVLRAHTIAISASSCGE